MIRSISRLATVVFVSCLFAGILSACATTQGVSVPDPEEQNRLQAEEQERRLQAEQVNQSRLALLRSYRIGQLTEEQFYSDDWDAREPFYGRVGVIGGRRIADALTFILGVYEAGDSPRTSSIIHHVVGVRLGMSTTYPANLSPAQLERLANDFQYGFERVQDRETDFEWQAAFGRTLGTLEFRHGVLDAISLSNQ